MSSSSGVNAEISISLQPALSTEQFVEFTLGN